MLKIHFINVAEGDATLIEYFNLDRIVRILVDTGRSYISEDKDSVHLRAAEYLRKNGVDYLDDVIITHLHVDHSAGLTDVLQTVKVGNLYSSYFPKDITLRVRETPDAGQHVYELQHDLNAFAANLQAMEKNGTEFHYCLNNRTLLDTEDFILKILTADETSVAEQNLIYDEMYEHINLPGELRYWASEVRNPNSMRVDITYAGRRILIEGDYLGTYTEEEKSCPCDILKVTHHGDAKTFANGGMRMQLGSHAVISCQRQYVPKKDRPSKKVADLYRERGSSIYYTDSFAEPGHAAIKREALVFTITDEGEILAPQAN